MWSKNGIEYFYPPAIVDDIYGQGNELTIDGDRVSRNGTTHKKAELATMVVGRVMAGTTMHPEFGAFLAKLGRAIGVAADTDAQNEPACASGRSPS